MGGGGCRWPLCSSLKNKEEQESFRVKGGCGSAPISGLLLNIHSISVDAPVPPPQICLGSSPDLLLPAGNLVCWGLIMLVYRPDRKISEVRPLKPSDDPINATQVRHPTFCYLFKSISYTRMNVNTVSHCTVCLGIGGMLVLHADGWVVP